MSETKTCAICSNSIADGDPNVSKLGQKGSEGINRASKERNENILTAPGEHVHQSCRRTYCHPSNIAQARRRENADDSVASNQRQLVRKAEHCFSFKTDCFFCGTRIEIHKQKKLAEAFRVTTIEFKDKVLETCAERGDAWAEVVRTRILSVHDLPAADAIYHQSCSVNFRTKKQIPKQYASQPENKKSNTGRPEDEEKRIAFLKVVEFLRENDDEQITVSDLIEKMNEHLGGGGAYGRTHMKAKLKEHLGEEVIITSINGKPNVVTFVSTAKNILQEFHENQKQQENQENEALNILTTAARLIKNDIKRISTSNDSYPVIETEAAAHVSFLPASLKNLLLGILLKKSEIKIASIGQAIMQAARPRVLTAPLQIGLAIQLHHNYASRFLIDTLHRLGFCSPYNEVQAFNKSAAVDQGSEIPSYEGEFVQYVADNVDHNLRTLDGHDTFHGMGMIATVTPGTKRNRCVPKRDVSNEEIATAGQIVIEAPTEPRLPLIHIKYNKVVVKQVLNPTANLDVLWKTSILFGISRPAWSGTMQSVHQSTHQGQSSVHFLPMIDMSPSDITCVHSTLQYLLSHAQSHNIPYCIITLDQPLWWKAYTIIESERADSSLRNIILRLGGFHTEMTFLGSIGHLMGGSGLREVMETVYASNAVDHILTGKAISRAVRAHLLVDAVLNTLLYSEALGERIPQLENAATDDSHEPITQDEATSPDNIPAVPLLPREDGALNHHLMSTSDDEGCTSNDITAVDHDLESTNSNHVKEAHQLYEDLMKEKLSVDKVCAASVLTKIKESVKQKAEEIRLRSRTAALWLQYMNMVDILRTFIKAERTANWELHLHAISQMLPYLAASGHNHYLKCALLYLQSMTKLESDNPEVYKRFMEGCHVVRHSDRYWASLSTDLVIEQVLMRSLKTAGGLTRGRGMTEQQRTTWLLSTPACAETSQAMQELTGVLYNSGEQNKDMTSARQQRDMKDTMTILSLLSERSPFMSNATFRNIMNGVSAEEIVNADSAKAIGEKILSEMTGQSVIEYSFKRSEQANTLSSSNSVKIDKEHVQIDPQLLFQRLVLACNTADDFQSVFQYELCTYPTALFEAPGVMRQANKPALADALCSQLSSSVVSQSNPPPGTHYVLDGGALIHRCPWPRPGSATYQDLCDMYCRYVTRHYGKPSIVFDGYDNLTTKSMTQHRRAAHKVGATVSFTEDMKVTMKKENFLSNSQNKKSLIEMLSESLRSKGCLVLQADGDADLLIVKTAVESSEIRHTTLVGDDTDLLVLLCYYTNVDNFDLVFRPEPKARAKQRMWPMKKVKTELGKDVCDNILFIHAFLGCDTTSRIFEIGKGATLKKFLSNPYFREQIKVFNAGDSSVDDVVKAGENALVSILNSKPGENINELRYRRYYEQLASKKVQVQPQSLPPSSAALRYHSLRVYLQIKQWKGEDAGMDINQWGWNTTQDLIVPLMTDLPPAPESLLSIIRCNCASDCSTRRCTCRKHNLDCSPACGQCKGVSCTNSPKVDGYSDANDE